MRLRVLATRILSGVCHFVRSLRKQGRTRPSREGTGQGGRLVELKPAVLRAFDRFLADTMSGHDLLHQLALGRIAGAAAYGGGTRQRTDWRPMVRDGASAPPHHEVVYAAGRIGCRP
jgi:hypothetical protein